MSETASPVVRTTSDDDLFIRMDQALGVPVVNQATWRLTSAPTEPELDRLADRLATGRLGRLLRRSPVPLVRDHWIADPHRSGRRVGDETPIPVGGLTAWIDEAASTTFDLVEGPVWELRSAPLAAGGAAVSLCVAHAAGDGAMIVRAILDALEPDADHVFAARPPTRLEEARDALGQAVTIAGSLGGLLTGALPLPRGGQAASTAPAVAALTARTSATLPEDPRIDPDDVSALAPMCVVSVATQQWDEVAAAAGGSSNSLFIGLVLGMVVASGRAGPDDDVRISIPMSLRTADDDRSNATTGLSLDLPARAAVDKDLAVVRRLAKAVYTAGTGAPSTFVRLRPVMQALGDRAVAALSANATTPLALASSLGTLDGVFAGLGVPGRAGGVVTRSTTQRVSAARLRHLRGGLAAWTNEAGGTTTVSIIGLDPDGLGRHSLHDVVHGEFARWSLHATDW